MSTAKMPWFRLYSEAIDDEKLKLIAAEDRWYFVAILCCKGQGVLDKADALLKRKVAVKLGVQLDTLDEIARRLSEVGLIDRDTLQPLRWEARQMRSDTSTERVRRHREAKQRSGNADETLHATLHATLHETEDETLHETLDETDVQRSSNALEEEEEGDKEEDTDKTKVKNKNTAQTRKRAADASPKSVDDGEKPLTIAALVAEGVERQHARDWLTLRKAKRLPLTPTAWMSVKAEAAECAMTPAQAVQHAVESNWAGFKAKWVLNSAALARASPRVDRNDRSAAAAAIFPRGPQRGEVIDV
ncbi:hypothetical protein [Burkholderia plantarii]|uniref:DUF1376 domain-containing protein n=1 Tax=Burkholderia plantarii TaxID=41899 RepID=A0A0B6RVK6_BURPL|nr:hypothetical protein [Burkholderia plantarii]AJK46199.1 hypothetical protein BGL_1c16900 [Burkholderia plantarii]